MTIQTTTSRATQLLARAGEADASLGRFRAYHVGALDHAIALADNGFTVFRGLFSAIECGELTAELKAEAGIRDGVKFTKIDAANSFRAARELLLEGRIVDAARAATGTEVRFLQVSDLAYWHDTAGWHRDSVHRAEDASAAPDWSDPDTPYRVVKAILYLEADNAAMGFVPGSHLSPIEMDHVGLKRIAAAGGQIVIEGGVEPSRKLTDQRKPVVWKADVGDVLVFDERTFHAGR